MVDKHSTVDYGQLSTPNNNIQIIFITRCSVPRTFNDLVKGENGGGQRFVGEGFLISSLDVWQTTNALMRVISLLRWFCFSDNGLKTFFLFESRL